MNHEPFIHRCLSLAARGRGLVGNGALVGAVLLRNGVIIAEGFHVAFGSAHAERDLLEKFTDAIEPDDILYVNLEPCCHHGKTPPCTDIILERSIKHVIYGMQDPDLRVAGKGIEILRASGVTVTGPVSLPLCQRLNRGFISVRTKNRPFITLKKAMTRKGEIANEDGSPMRITTKEQDVWSHTNLRSTHDAILVGVGTIIADDPRLDARLAISPTPSPSPAGRGGRQYIPWRIILDARFHMPLDARVVADEYCNRTIVIHAPIVSHDMELVRSELQHRGVRLFEVPLQEYIFDWSVLWQSLITPDQNYHGLTSILVEGGARTWEMFMKAGMVDEEITLVGNE